MQTRTISNETLQPHNRNRLAVLRAEAQAMANEYGCPVRWVQENGDYLTTFNPKA